ncbi:MAG: SRPBCC domain-containing protein [Caulobacteraceae bacterium]|nr:SRPBCC domain-containing protein [Caulobacteraceae bacterium]
MTDAAAPTRPIILEAALDAPPDLVWRALTEPELMARWLGASDIEAKVGRCFTVRPDGPVGEAPIACEVLEAEPGRMLSYRWRATAPGEAAALDTVVTWVLEPTAEGGTRLRLVHDGFPVVLQGAIRGQGAGVSTMSAVRRRQAPDLRRRGDGRAKMSSGEVIKWAA